MSSKLLISTCILLIIYAKFISTKSNTNNIKESTHPNNAEYHFTYAIDSKHAIIHRHEQSTASGHVKGCYSIRQADGRFRLVKYVADDKGFRAKVVTNEPGSSNSSSSVRPSARSSQPTTTGEYTSSSISSSISSSSSSSTWPSMNIAEGKSSPVKNRHHERPLLYMSGSKTDPYTINQTSNGRQPQTTFGDSGITTVATPMVLDEKDFVTHCDQNPPLSPHVFPTSGGGGGGSGSGGSSGSGHLTGHLRDKIDRRPDHHTASLLRKLDSLMSNTSRIASTTPATFDTMTNGQLDSSYAVDVTPSPSPSPSKPNIKITPRSFSSILRSSKSDLPKATLISPGRKMKSIVAAEQHHRWIDRSMIGNSKQREENQKQQHQYQYQQQTDRGSHRLDSRPASRSKGTITTASDPFARLRLALGSSPGPHRPSPSPPYSEEDKSAGNEQATDSAVMSNGGEAVKDKSDLKVAVKAGQNVTTTTTTASVDGHELGGINCSSTIEVKDPGIARSSNNSGDKRSISTESNDRTTELPSDTSKSGHQLEASLIDILAARGLGKAIINMHNRLARVNWPPPIVPDIPGSGDHHHSSASVRDEVSAIPDGGPL
ncbi:uncharacterized protein LOC141855851 [Brevipalpus obovatus]|uniref:uncharacterized protein LOC141855851 n=1 Tax=Brevipalpus obovatus TaxID=246614 RepID=UPI003D9F7831